MLKYHLVIQMEKNIKKGQIYYIIEATLEYFISIMVAGSFLATLTKDLGFSDSLTGILSSVISLGCVFQLFSIFIRKRKVKKFVIAMSVVNQLLFMLLYIIPFFAAKSTYKITFFFLIIILSYLIYYVAHPKKTGWQMSLVEDSKRGSFTANKEIVSLITGIFFNLAMGAIVDHFIEKNQIKTAFLISAAVIFLCMLLHTFFMIFTPETIENTNNKNSFIKSVKNLFKNNELLKVTALLVMYNVVVGMTTPFYGTYLISELGFSLKFVAMITIGSSIVRIFVSKFWGRYADKKSFAQLIEKCLLVLSLALMCVVFATPSTGSVTFAFYYIFHGIAMGGINSALFNLVFDTVKNEERSDALAINQAISGVAAFVTTLIASPVLTLIQENGNKIFGVTVYAQQLFSFVGLLIIAGAIIFVRFSLIKKKA